ncbi:MAG: hypothetical protein IT332_04785 [Ardenticatenales bacterium]|nr:hypothetical protein [Ardenticatenales bacterium]
MPRKKQPDDDSAAGDRTPRPRIARTARRASARKIVLRTAWLDGLFVYWAGEPPESSAVTGGFRPASQLIAERLAGLPAGVYTMRRDAGADEPCFPEAIRVDEPRFVDAVRAWTQAADYPRALPELVGALATWRAGIARRIEYAGEALRAEALAGTSAPAALGLESHCLWIGPAAARPSQRLPTPAIAACLATDNAASEPVRRLAAIVLGQRRADRGLPANTADWAVCGRVLHDWAPDVVLRAADCDGGGPAALAAAVAAARVPAAAGAEACALECLVTAPGSDPRPLLAGLAPAVRATGELYDEPARRRAELIALLDDAGRHADAAWRLRRPGSQAPRGRRWTAYLRTAIVAAYADVVAGAGRMRPAPVPRSESGIVELTASVTGVRLAPDDVAVWLQAFTRLPAAGLGTAFAERFPAADDPAADTAAAQRAVCGQLGRWWAVGCLDLLPGALADWLHVCRLALAPAEGAEGMLATALESFGAGLKAAAATGAGSPMSVDGLSALLTRHGRELFEDIAAALEWRDGVGRGSVLTPVDARGPLAERTALLGRLSALGTTSLGPALTLGLGRLLLRVERLAAHAAPRFLAALAADPDHPLRATRNHGDTRQCWPAIRVWTIDDEATARRLWSWACSLRREFGIGWDDATDMLDEVLDFCLATMPRHGNPPGDDMHPPHAADFAAKRAFLAVQLPLLRQLTIDAVDAAVLLNQSTSEHDTGPDMTFGGSIQILSVLHAWHRAGRSDVDRLARTLRRSQQERTRREADRLVAAQAAGKRAWIDVPWLPDRPDDHALAIELSGGDARAVPALLAAVSARGHPRRSPEHAHAGWLYLERFPVTRTRLIELARRPEWIGRVLDILERFALSARFPERRAYEVELSYWESPPVPSGLDLPADCPPDVRAALEHLAAYRALVGRSEPFGAEVRRLLEGDGGRGAEIAALEARRAAGALSPSAAARLAKLRGEHDIPARAADRAYGILAKRAPKLADLAALDALEATVRQVIDAHWTAILGAAPPADTPERDWDNALFLYHHLEHNRPLLLRLLRDVAAGRVPVDLLGHPANAAFAGRVGAAGVDIAAWLAPLELRRVVHVAAWRIYVATDPLEVLQMGNLFDTCLAVDGFNAFAAVANAMEVNKRVLYVRDERGHVIGRRLLVLSADGLVFGHHSYGMGALYDDDEDDEDGGGRSPWVKIHLEALCAALAERAGARLARPAESVQRDSTDFALFAQWYFDGLEPFDPWQLGEPIDLDALLPWPDAAEQDYPLQRYLTFLGDAALPFLERIPPPVGAASPALRWVGRHTQSEAVRGLVRGWDVDTGGRG